jgi:hypothetical protein
LMAVVIGRLCAEVVVDWKGATTFCIGECPGG